MRDGRHGKAYRGLKWSWLLMQCLMPPLAAWYVAGQPGFAHPPWAEAHPLWRGGAEWLMIMMGSGYLVLWLIVEALLIMYRFPLETPAAFTLVVGYVIQLVVMVLTGGSLFFAAFVSLFVTLGALYGCVVLLLGFFLAEDFRRNRPVRKKFLLGLAFCLLGVLPFVVLFPFLQAGFRNLGRAAMAVIGLVLLANAVVTTRSVMDFSIWGRPDPLRPRYDKEWESWAGPTIILLILSVVAAVALAGIRGA
ncbi:MAG: hypothetical protein KKC51_12035 [Verrucomicrobia bacterium]|nr:hypothetical protein [Verrucomicrobiota bacterium]